MPSQSPIPPLHLTTHNWPLACRTPALHLAALLPQVNVTQKRYAVASAVAASGVPALVMARGHRIEQTPGAR